MFQPLEHELFIVLELHPNSSSDTRGIVHGMAPQKRQASQQEASGTKNRKTEGSYSTNPNTVEEMNPREAMDDRSWAKDVMHRRVNTAVSIAKSRLRNSVACTR